MDVSIQAVSPELNVQSLTTAGTAGFAFAGSLSSTAATAAAQAGGPAASSAYDGCVNVVTLRKTPRKSPSTRAKSPAREKVLNVIVSTPVARGAGSECRNVGLAGADAHGVVESHDEDLAVADLAGLGRRRDRLDGLLDHRGVHCDLDLDLGQEAHGVFGAAIDFGVALLAPVSLDLRDGHPVHADRSQIGRAH